MSKRAFGTWILQEGGTIVDEAGKAVAVVAASRGALIAAAPDLLEALKLAATQLENYGSRNQTLLGTIRDAIDKAEGKP